MLISMSDYYQQIYVLTRREGSDALRYVCYKDLRTGQFCVSSGETLSAPQDAASLTWNAVNQVDHFINEGVNRWFNTLLEAVDCRPWHRPHLKEYRPITGCPTAQYA